MNLLTQTKPSSIFLQIVETCIAFVLLCFSLPIVLVFALLIMLESKGSPFFLQQRIGLNGQPFMLIKLRSMRLNAERTGPKWANSNDDRVTTVGRWIRKTRIDELPQLINVLQGHMSFIGPRPERAHFTEAFYKENALFLRRLTIKPGITGWAQVNGGYDLDYNEKLKMDLYYIENRSLRLNLSIVWRTINVVVGGNGAR